MKKPEFKTPLLPQRSFAVETSEDAVDALISGRPTSTIRERPPVAPTPESRGTPAPASTATPPSPPLESPAAAPKENVQRYTAWPYPSQLQKLRGAVDDYRRRHPKRKLSINDLIRGALDLVPPEGTDLDAFVNRMAE
jgi:hypothetical protein